VVTVHDAVEGNLDNRTCQGASQVACRGVRMGRHMVDIGPLASHMASLRRLAVLLPLSYGFLDRVHLVRVVVVHVPGMHHQSIPLALFLVAPG
jgi:hypothetical protein